MRRTIEISASVSGKIPRSRQYENIDPWYSIKEIIELDETEDIYSPEFVKDAHGRLEAHVHDMYNEKRSRVMAEDDPEGSRRKITELWDDAYEIMKIEDEDYGDFKQRFYEYVKSMGISVEDARKYPHIMEKVVIALRKEKNEQS